MEVVPNQPCIGTNSKPEVETRPTSAALVEELTPPRTESPSSDIPNKTGVGLAFEKSMLLESQLEELFEENITAKVLRAALDHLPVDQKTGQHVSEPNSSFAKRRPPTGFPEFVPQTGERVGTWMLREPTFWTAGFFPGTLHLILERLVKFRHRHSGKWQENVKTSQLRSELQKACQLWSEPLHEMAHRRDTHDLGFMIMPALQKDWELTGSPRSLSSIITAARNLASRYVNGAQAIRSWDARVQKNLQITCQCQNVLLIIDSMCNLDLLYYAAGLVDQGAQELYDIATAHAKKLISTHLRPEKTTPVNQTEKHYDGQWYSTYHVVNVDPQTGEIKQRFTAQGYSRESTWARGQAWGILGYAQTYVSTKDIQFLEVACGLSEYFLFRLESGPPWPQEVESTSARPHWGGRYVPLWDFDAPHHEAAFVRDSSAGSIAANGMLVISQALASLGKENLASRFRKAAVDLIEDSLHFALSSEKAFMKMGLRGIEVHDTVDGKRFEALMKHGTANNNEHAMRKYSDHGIVYGDYYLVQFGNRLLGMGLV